MQLWAEIDDSLQEQQHMKLALKADFGVSWEEFEFEIHLLDLVRHLVQAILEQAEHLVFVSAVLIADCFEELLVELLEPRSNRLLACKFLPKVVKMTAK